MIALPAISWTISLASTPLPLKLMFWIPPAQNGEGAQKGQSPSWIGKTQIHTLPVVHY